MSWEEYPKEVQQRLKDSPAMVDAINKMVKDGYSKDAIMRVTGAPYEMVDARMGGQKRGRAERTESERQVMRERMAKARAGRKKKPGAVAEALNKGNTDASD